MTLYKLLLLLLIIPFCVEIGSAQESSATHSNAPTQFINVPKVLSDRVERFFEILGDNNVQKAFDVLLEGSPLKNKEEQVAKLVEQTKHSIILYGKSTGSEAVNSEIASTSLIRLRYLGLNMNFPMRWIFTFYNSPRFGWVVVNVKLDDMSEYFFTDE